MKSTFQIFKRRNYLILPLSIFSFSNAEVLKFTAGQTSTMLNTVSCAASTGCTGGNLTYDYTFPLDRPNEEWEILNEITTSQHANCIKTQSFDFHTYVKCPISVNAFDEPIEIRMRVKLGPWSRRSGDLTITGSSGLNLPKEQYQISVVHEANIEPNTSPTHIHIVPGSSVVEPVSISIFNHGPSGLAEIKFYADFPEAIKVDTFDDGCIFTGSRLTCGPFSLDPGKEKKVKVGLSALPNVVNDKKTIPFYFTSEISTISRTDIIDPLTIEWY